MRFTQTRRNLLYSCGDDCQIKVWDLEALAKGCKFSMEGHTDRVILMILLCFPLSTPDLFLMV